MKIIISPSKTQNPTKSAYLTNQEIIYPIKHKKILTLLQKLKKNQINKIMKINKTLLDNTYNNIQNYSNLATFHAFESFNGLVFKGLQKEQYHSAEYDYIESNLLILDAFYGILKPGSLIKLYRLDMKMKIGVNLYSFWDISNYFKNELIINLASNEFSKMIDCKNTINVSFLQYKNNSYVNQATYTKQARGQFLNYLIINHLLDPQQMKNFNESNYTYNAKLSDDKNIIFSRIG